MKKIILFFKIFIVSFALIIIIGLSAYAYLRGSWFRSPDMPHVGGENRKEAFFTFLIVGIDHGVNTDTIMVGSYDAVNKRGHIIGIPRDTYVDASRSVKKLNAAYSAGTRNGGGKEGGIGQLKSEIKTLIGFVPDFYVCVNFEAFENIIDSLGGVDIDVPYDMRYDDPTPGHELHIDIKAGYRRLDGANALKFARYRKSNIGSGITDYKRIENQQAVMNAALEKLLTPAGLLKIPRFVQIFNDNVGSDLTAGNMLWFANQLNKIKGTDALTMHTLPTSGTSGPPMYYELPDKVKILDLVNETINPFK